MGKVDVFRARLQKVMGEQANEWGNPHAVRSIIRKGMELLADMLGEAEDRVADLGKRIEALEQKVYSHNGEVT